MCPLLYPQASLELQLQFVRALRDQLTEDDYTPILFNIDDVEEAQMGDGEQEEEAESKK